jgi:hypothetical protein
MRSLKHWQKRQMIMEFAGPAGQVDPTGFGSVSMPNVVPMAPAGAARPGMASNAMMRPPQVQEDPNELPTAAQGLLKTLSSKSPAQIIQFRNHFNQEVQDILMHKSISAGRAGMRDNLSQAKTMQSNFGQPVV